jgi:hypothetical protein
MAAGHGRSHHNRYKHDNRHDELAKHDSIPAGRRETTSRVDIDGQRPSEAGQAAIFAL